MPALDYLFFAAELLNLKKLGHELVTIRITDSDDEHWYPVGLCPMLNRAQNRRSKSNLLAFACRLDSRTKKYNHQV